jgi:hypothetical protein
MQTLILMTVRSRAATVVPRSVLPALEKIIYAGMIEKKTASRGNADKT